MLCLFTVTLTAFYTIFTYLAVIHELFQYLTKGGKWTPLAGKFLTFCFVWLYVGVHKIAFCMVYKCSKVGNHHQSRINILFGLTFIAFFSFCSKVVLENTWDEENGAEKCVFFAANLFFASYFLFIYLPSDKYCWDKKPEGCGYEFLLVILVFINAGTCIKTIINAIGRKNPESLIIIQIYFSLICASSTCDILAILMGKLKEKRVGHFHSKASKMLCLLTASFTAVYAIFLHLDLFFSIFRVLFNGWRLPLLSTFIEYFAAWLVVGVVKILMCIFHKWRKIGNYHQSRNNILLGLTLIAFFSMLGKILIRETTAVRNGGTTFVLFNVICFFASYFLFIHLPSGKFYWNTKPGSRVYEILLVILVFIHAGLFIKTLLDITDHEHTQLFSLVYFFYSLICASSTTDILAILMGRLEEKSKEYPQNECLIQLEEAESSSAVLMPTSPPPDTHLP